PYRVDNISYNEIKDQIIIRNELLDNYDNIHTFSEDISSLTPNDNNTNLDNSNNAEPKEYEITNTKSNLYNKNSETVSLLRRRKIDNPALEELFEEQGMSWNQKEFGKEYQL
ncbi:10017_t:CDS:2, partial [Scutellospora calospora]